MRVYSCCIRRSRSSRIACIPRSVSLFSFSRLSSDRCCCCCSCCCCCARLAPRNHHANVVAVEQNLVQLGHHHTVLAVVGGGEGRGGRGREGVVGVSKGGLRPKATRAYTTHTHTLHTHTHTHGGQRERESRRRGRQITYYSFTSSNTMLTNSSNPRSVPAISRSPFIRIHKREPMHLSMSSV